MTRSQKPSESWSLWWLQLGYRLWYDWILHGLQLVVVLCLITVGAILFGGWQMLLVLLRLS
jgi:hypothetical protein